MGCNGVPRVDRWKQALIWRNQDPRTLSTTGRFTKSQVEQVQILELQSRWQFGARRCVGLAGSYRPVQTPIVGSCLWSVLLSGK